MKLCKDCSFFRAPSNGLHVTAYAHCTYGIAMSPVTGELDMPTQSNDYCVLLRKSEKASDCGAEARFFMPSNLAVGSSAVIPLDKRLS